MSLVNKQKARTARRVLRVRKKLSTVLPRVSVFKSLKHIYAQIIDQAEGKTVVSCSSLELKELKGDKKSVARSIGIELAKRAKSKGIDTVVFDRGSYLYHGRVKELAEGLREGNIKV